MQTAVLAIDIGTSALKAGLVGLRGDLLGQETVPLTSQTPHPDHHEYDPLDWVRALRTAVGAGLLGKHGGEIGAVVVSGNGPTLTGVDVQGEPTLPGMSWLDRRAKTESEELKRAWHGGVEASHVLAKMLWVCRQAPEAYRRTRWFLSCPEYLSYVLTGRPCTVLPAPGFEPYYWTDRVVAAVGLDRGKLPEFVAPGERLGNVTGNAARKVGVPVGTPVFAGGPDFLMSLVGTNTLSEGMVCDRAGTSEGVNLCSRSSVSDPALRCFPHLVSGMHNVSAVLGGTGLVVEWLRGLCAGAGAGAAPRGDIFAGIEGVAPGAGGLLFLPGLTGYSGLQRGAFLGLSFQHGRDDLARAVAESLGFGVREVLDLFRRHNLPVREIRVSGGQARSRAVLQIKADIAGVPVVIPGVADAELVGAAAVGFTGLGEYGGIPQAAAAMVRTESTLEPDPSRASAYGQLLVIRRESVERLKGVLEDLSGYTHSS